MSSFVHPALFWGGIGLVSIPIIIHLLNRRRYRRIDWAAMEFLLDALRRNRRRIRIEQLILLLVRIAAILLIVTALARPHLSQTDYGWLSGPFQSEEKLFILDDSLSMGHVDAGRSSLRRGREALLAACERIALDGGRDPVTILRASSFEAPLFNAVHLDSERLAQLRDYLEGRALEPTAVRLDLVAMLEDLASRGRPERGRSISIITDLCASDWTDSDGGLKPELRAALERLGGDENDTTRVLLLDVGAGRRDNLALAELSLAQAQPIVGIPIELRVEITNHGTRPVRGVGIRLRTAESLTPGPRVDTLGSGETVTLAVPHAFRRPGPTWIRAELDGVGASDGLLADNTRDLVVDVLEAVDVLIVDGEPSGTFGEGESDFLLQALRPPGDVRSGFAPSAVVSTNLPQDGLDRFGVIVLANLGDLPEEFVAKLSAYVRGGGGLVLFPGDQVEASRYERVFGIGTPEHPGADLLPATLGDVTGDPDRPAHLAPLFEHPAFRLLSGAGDELFRLVDVARFFELEVPESSRVIARLTDANSSAFLVERTVGDGKVVLCASPADLEWSDWPRNPTFLPVVLEMLGSLSRPRGALWNRLAGAPVDVPIDLARFQRRARWRDPDYPRSSEKKILAVGDHGDTETEADANIDYRFTLLDTRRAGVHTLILRSVSGEDIERLFALRPDPIESDLRAVNSGAQEALFADLDVRVLRDPDAFLEGGPGRFEIADALLLAFLAMLFVESILAWLFGHHARRRETTSATSGSKSGSRPGSNPANPIAQRMSTSGGRP